MLILAYLVIISLNIKLVNIYRLREPRLSYYFKIIKGDQGKIRLYK